MISTEEFKKSLGKTANELTEEQILELRENQDKMAELLFYMWLKKIKQEKQNSV